jgi:hypothetical protein
MWQGCNIGTILKGTITGEDEAEVARFGNPFFADEDDAESGSVEAAEGGSPDEVVETTPTTKGGKNKGGQK